jgi:hypothetical protein
MQQVAYIMAHYTSVLESSFLTIGHTCSSQAPVSFSQVNQFPSLVACWPIHQETNVRDWTCKHRGNSPSSKQRYDNSVGIAHYTKINARSSYHLHSPYWNVYFLPDSKVMAPVCKSDLSPCCLQENKLLQLLLLTSILLWIISKVCSMNEVPEMYVTFWVKKNPQK